ncbi:hypothetical protein [Amycolatopsis keratiniphila]|uniref:Uncharacterized protein n=1 Tax=Amycolatopsis keratiniphila subsp. keratiniphila TaxID=227715 RepID=A0A1W2M221_9PSEU|nr:hypothetical protein [Amycolatopsis keratiniphila]ONF73952.1 hypothetical protein AVR91_0204275 [Amycolatopsis keratiniphila subsp. keratiniphila]
MAAPTAPLDPTTAILAGISAHQVGLFRGRNLRVRASTVVHGVRLWPWTAGLELPGPACGQGWSGAGLGGELHPTDDPVTCHHCLHSSQARAAFRLDGSGPGQLALDLDLDGQTVLDLPLPTD